MQGHVYTDCADIGLNCYDAAYNDTSTADLNIENMAVTAGTTYYIVISTWFNPATEYTINIQQENCPKPTGLTATGATMSSVTLGWTEMADADAWQYVVQPVGTGLPMTAGTAVTDTTLPLSSLPDSTQFELYVRSDCGNGTFSAWSGPMVFNTLCGAFDVPFHEGFDSDSSSQFCWAIADTNGDGGMWDMDFSFSFYGGDQSAKFDASWTSENDDMLISPAINLTDNQRLRFFYKTQQFGAVAFKVMMSTTGTDPEDFTTELSPLTSYAVDNFTEKTINLSAAPVGPVYFAWHVPAGVNGGTELMIDDVVVENMPPCAQPIDIAVSEISDTTALLSWTAGNNETAWEVIVSDPNVSGTPSNSTSGTPVAAASFTANGLTPNTLYGAYIRSMCGINGTTDWVGPLFFTTGCESYDVPFFEGFNSDSPSQQCWRIFNADGDWAQWNMEDGQPFEGDEAATIYTGNSPDNDWIISPAINLTGNERLKYHYKVSDGENGETGFKVLLSTTNFDLDSFTEVLVPESQYTNEEYVKQVVSLEAYTGPVYIAWQVPPGYEYGSDLLLDNVIVEAIPACPEPLNLTINTTTETSAELSWTSAGTETAWEVFVNIAGEDAPATGVPATTMPFTLTTMADGSPLQSGTTYEVAVRAVCSATENSILSDETEFTTKIVNDECSAATVIPVNTGSECVVFVSGTINGATGSPQENTCGDWTSADDDVWFEFTATSPIHTLTFYDISGGNTVLMYGLYSGDSCDALSQIGYCEYAYAEWEPSTSVLTDLTVGDTYTIRLFSPDTDEPLDATFKICIKVPATPIAVNDTEHTVEQLVTDVFMGSDCAQITNITWSTGSDFEDEYEPFGPNGIAYFDRNGSDFPFEEGIVMTTGDALRAPGPNYGALEQGTWLWPGDDDLETIIEAETGEPMDSQNATIIEFDFVPLIPTLSFDFIFASEEYGFWQCGFTDAFAFILTDADGNVQNLAKIPGTTTPVSVTTIRDEAYNVACDSQHPEFFGQFNGNGAEESATIDFDGQTIAMSAVANVTVNTQYHIKMVIADWGDPGRDSAIFLKGGSFSIGKVELGADLLADTNTAICAGGDITLHTGFDPANFDFEWSKDGVVMTDETGPDLVVTTPGTYKIKTTLTGSVCSSESDIIIEFYPAVEDVTGDPSDLKICEPDGFYTFDLSTNTTAILEGLDAGDYTVSYHLTQDAAEADTGAIALTYTNTVQFEQTLYVRIYDNTTACFGIKSFSLIAQDLTPEFTLSNDFSICQGTTGTITVTPGNFTPADVTFSWTKNGAPLPDTTAAIAVTQAGTYAVIINNSGCTATGSVAVTVTPVPVADEPSDVIECVSYTLPALSANNSYYTGTGGTGTQIAAGTAITATQTLYVYAQSGSTPNCTDENSFVVNITPLPVVTTPGDQAVCNSYVLPALTQGSYFTGAGGTGTQLNAGFVVTITQTIYVYVAGTSANCTAEADFTVTITDTPAADQFEDVAECNSYTLPALSANNSYYTAAGGTGTQLAPGTVITTSQTLFIFAQSGTTVNCTAESSFAITITPTPSFSLGGPYVSCEAANVTLMVEADNFDTETAAYAWTLNGAAIDGSESLLDATGFGSYGVTVTVNGCSHTETVEVSLDTTAVDLDFAAGCDDNTYMLEVVPVNDSFNPDTATYVWTGPDGFTSGNNGFEVLKAGTYTVTVTTAESCTGQESYEVLNTTCDVPKGISPNNDTYNDTFDLTGLDVKKISIFNRYGQEVYSLNNYTNQWHGQGSNGDELPTGTYFYALERKNGDTKTGWVYINREEK
jgi:gliding motility-associated-like protein